MLIAVIGWMDRWTDKQGRKRRKEVQGKGYPMTYFLSVGWAHSDSF